MVYVHVSVQVVNAVCVYVGVCTCILYVHSYVYLCFLFKPEKKKRWRKCVCVCLCVHTCVCYLLNDLPDGVEAYDTRGLFGACVFGLSFWERRQSRKKCNRTHFISYSTEPRQPNTQSPTVNQPNQSWSTLCRQHSQARKQGSNLNITGIFLVIFQLQ